MAWPQTFAKENAMTALFATFFADIADQLFQKLGIDIMDYIKTKRQQKANLDAANASVAPLQAAQTGQEVSDATDDAIGGV